jgi:hypothetical protein
MKPAASAPAVLSGLGMPWANLYPGGLYLTGSWQLALGELAWGIGTKFSSTHSPMAQNPDCEEE